VRAPTVKLAPNVSPSDETIAGIRKLAEQGRTAAAAKMTTAQIAEAQQLARE
jgi:hypothetical protein